MKRILGKKDLLAFGNGSLFQDSTPLPDNAWALSKPVLHYADYLFRRITITSGMEAVKTAILTGEWNHRFFGEHLNPITRVFLSLPYLAVTLKRQKSGRDVVQMEIPKILTEVFCGSPEWKYFVQNTGRSLMLTEKEAAENVFCYSIHGWIVRNFEGLISKDAKIVEAIEYGAHISKFLNCEHKLYFRFLMSGWINFEKSQY